MPEFKLPDQLPTLLRWLFSSVVAASATCALVKLKADSGTAGILYLALVVWAATLAGPRLSIYLAVVTSFLFDYFFLPPLHTLGLYGIQSWLAMISFVVSCVIVGSAAKMWSGSTP
jgi:two-component system sensor histidine kinase KdpD